MIKVKIRTFFDITVTGVTGHFKESRIPFKTKAGQIIGNMDSWNRARNQQRNWETLVQLISLRTQIDTITDPTCHVDRWEFEFTIEQDVFNDGADSVGVLKGDSEGVPMLRELDNNPDIDAVLITQGLRQNIWFKSEHINNVLENTDG
jgi:hypothetical protein